MIIRITICLHFQHLPFMVLYQLLLIMDQLCNGFFVGFNDAAVDCDFSERKYYLVMETHLSFAFVLSFSVIRLTSASSRCSASLSFFSMSSERVLRLDILFYFLYTIRSTDWNPLSLTLHFWFFSLVHPCCCICLFCPPSSGCEIQEILFINTFHIFFLALFTLNYRRSCCNRYR